MAAAIGALELIRQQRRVIETVGHRPWPLPEQPWFMAQTWDDLLFAHWPVPVEALRRVVPRSLPIDTYDGRAWIGVTPFAVRGLRLRGTPPPPLVSSFPELNVRTYVSVEGKPGIYFLSLDAGTAAAVKAARRAYRLPYFRARMSIERHGARIQYTSERRDPGGEPAAFAGSYEPVGPTFNAAAGSIEHWLAERYCLYTLDARAELLRADIHHPPWPLQLAEADLRRNTMTRPLRIDLKGSPLLHFARRQDVVIWRLARALGDA